MRSFIAALSSCALMACSGATTEPTDPGTDPGTNPGTSDDGLPPDTGTPVVDCTYPTSVEPMTLGEVIAPYAWGAARHRDGRQGDLDLEQVHCNNDDDVDWSPFDVLLFVSLPAW